MSEMNQPKSKDLITKLQDIEDRFFIGFNDKITDEDINAIRDARFLITRIVKKLTDEECPHWWVKKELPEFSNEEFWVCNLCHKLGDKV